MIRRTMHALLPLAAFVFAAPVLAQQATPVNSLEALLKQVEQVGAAADQAFNQHKAEFESKSQAEKDTLLRNAEQQRTQLNQASARLSETYQANELRIGNLNQQLRDKAQSLGIAELFGLARQAAHHLEDGGG